MTSQGEVNLIHQHRELCNIEESKAKSIVAQLENKLKEKAMQNYI
jgi:hypothetical protein